MKKLLTVLLVILFSSLFIFAQDKSGSKGLRSNSRTMMAGYLVDHNCGKRMVSDDVKKSDAKAARHTKDCALDETCSAAGYGLVTGGKYYKFDISGDRKAKEYLEATTKANNIKVEIIGTLNGERLAVESIKAFKSKGKNRGIKTNVQ